MLGVQVTREAGKEGLSKRGYRKRLCAPYCHVKPIKNISLKKRIPHVWIDNSASRTHGLLSTNRSAMYRNPLYGLFSVAFIHRGRNPQRVKITDADLTYVA